MQWASSMANSDSGTLPSSASICCVSKPSGEIEQLQVGSDRLDTLVRSVRRQRAIVKRRGDPVCAARRPGPSSRRSARRDDDGEAVHRTRRGLEAERLAATGRQHDDRVASGEHIFDRLVLQRAESYRNPIAG